MTTEAAKAAKARYDAKTARYISLKLNSNTDKDIIEKLNAQENIQQYIKNLIRNDMKEDKTMKKYIVKPEYLPLWGDDADENTIITQDDVERFAADWGVSFDGLMKQLEEVGDSLWEGYDPDNNHVQFVMDHLGHVWVCRQDGRELWNDEYYTEDGLPDLKLAILNEGYRLS